MKSLMHKLISSFVSHEKNSFSQSGEDRIVKFIFEVLGISKPTYLDIGAHHPTIINNTYLFYLLGGKGVLVDPNPKWCGIVHNIRPRDVFLNVGVSGLPKKQVPFYIMDSDTLSTFSKEEAERMVCEDDHEIVSVQYVDILTPFEIITEYLLGDVDFVSVDVEGLEIDILKSLDFDKIRPKVFCIETISYSKTGKGTKNTEIIEFMNNNAYLTYADTYVNTIFVDNEEWSSFGKKKHENS